MAKSVNKPPVKDDISLHKKGWVIQRIGWVIMFLFLASALFGLFGEGPLSKKSIRQANINFEFERFCRYEHGTKLCLQSNAENIGVVSIPQDYLKSFRVSNIIPEPGKQLTAAGFIHYQFEGTDNKIVTFYLLPVQRKTVKGIIQVNHNNSITIKQTIYP